MCRYKTLVALLVVLLGVFLLAGCGQGPAKLPSGGSNSPEQKAVNTNKEKYPDRPVRMILTHDVGSTVDMVGRTVASPFLEKILGAPVVAENMAGAGGRRARSAVYKAAPDGYTLLVSTMPSMQVGELAEGGDYKSREFTNLYNFHGFVGTGIYVAKDSPLQSVQDFLNKARQQKVPIGVPGGVGSLSYTDALRIQKASGAQFSIVPLNGTGEVVSNLLGKNVQAVIGDPSIVLRYPDQLRALAILNPVQVPQFQGVPTLKEVGLEIPELPFIVGFLAPPGLAAEKAQVLEAAMAKVAVDPAFKEAFAKAGMILDPKPAKEYKEIADRIYQRVQEILPMLKADQPKGGQPDKK